MKKLLILFVALFSVVGTMPSLAASKRNIMELPPFERAVLIIKKFETLHEPRHWPYIGYGHRVLSGEPYRKGVRLTEAQADVLLRKDLQKFVALYDHIPRFKLLLGVLAYNIGPGAVNKSSVYKKLKLGDTSIYKDYTSHCRYKGKWHKGLYQRRCTEILTLFIP